MSDETTNDTAVDAVSETPGETPVEAKVDAKVETKVEAKVETKVEAKVAAKVATNVATKVDDSDETRSNPRKIREGIVISDKMNSTLVVAVNERVRHARYGKTVQRTKKLYVHDEKNEAKVGDKVRVQETRPLSKLKRWRLTEIVERAR
jgi:small subunit ribosomal protein S17